MCYGLRNGDRAAFLAFYKLNGIIARNSVLKTAYRECFAQG